MLETKTDFLDRVNEINIYFAFIEKANKQNPILSYEEEDGSAVAEAIGVDLFRILKANGFLLIYNLVESCTRNCLKTIYTAIKTDALTFDALAEKVRIVWARQQVLNFQNAKEDSLRLLISGISEKIAARTFLELEEKHIKKSLSGNVDAKIIRKVAHEYGFDTAVRNPQSGDDLENIKKKRNALAHGELTFVECGRGYSAKEMIDFKDNAIDYMVSVMDNIERYIAGKHYSKYATGAVASVALTTAPGTSV